MNTPKNMLHTENDGAALYNLFASTQNSARQMIREKLYQPSQRIYNEEFINSQRLDPATTANIDYNAGLATPPLTNSAAVTPDSANTGVSSIGSSTTDISLLLDGLPTTAFVWTGSQVELIFTFNPPQIINRVTISLPAHQGISLVEFTSTPDGVLKEDLAADLPPENLSIDGSAGKYSGDWIADFDPRSVQQLRIVLADYVGNPSMTIRDVSFFQRTFSNAGLAQTLKIPAPQGTVLFTADQHDSNTLTSISHQISTDGVHYTAIVPGQQLTVGTSGFWYRASLQRLDSNFSQAANPISGQDPSINTSTTISSITTVDMGNGALQRSINLAAAAGTITLGGDVPLAGIQPHGACRGLANPVCLRGYTGFVRIRCVFFAFAVESRFPARPSRTKSRKLHKIASSCDRNAPLKRGRRGSFLEAVSRARLGRLAGSLSCMPVHEHFTACGAGAGLRSAANTAGTCSIGFLFRIWTTRFGDDFASVPIGPVIRNT
jgi:hypothetical protein